MFRVTVLLCKTFVKIDSPVKQLRLDCMQSMLNCYDEMQQWTADSPANMVTFSNRHIRQYIALNSLSADPDMYWKFYPKHHLFLHLAESGLNPASRWNYSEESKIGSIAKMAAKLHTSTMNRRLMERLRLRGIGNED